MELIPTDALAMIAGMASSTRMQRVSRAAIEGSAADIRYAAIAQHRILLEGPEISIEVVMSLLEPYLRKPITWNHRGTRLRLPSSNCGALVLHNVSELEADEQTRLGAWLNDSAHQTQIVSTTRRPLFRLVSANQFDERLYYRLNVVRCPLDQIEPEVSRARTATR
jgi:sigma-54-interacting transcriptional regulator